MPSFFDLQASLDRESDPISYMEGLRGLKKFRVAEMMLFMLDVVEGMHRGFKVADDVPTVRFVRGGPETPAAIANLILIPEDFVDRCLGAVFVPIEDVIPASAEYSFWDYRFISIMAMSWIVAHEYFHLIRPHRVFDAADGTRSRDVALATERDADLCAVAVIYRHFQRFWHQRVEDLVLRKVVLYCLFWVLRPMHTASDSDSHFSMALRLRDMGEKLAILNETPGGEADAGAVLPRTRERGLELNNCLLACEQAYIDASESAIPAWDDLRYSAENGKIPEVIRAWEQIRHLVDDVKRS